MVLILKIKKIQQQNTYNSWASTSGEVIMATGSSMVTLGIRLPPPTNIYIAGTGIVLTIIGGGLKIYDTIMTGNQYFGDNSVVTRFRLDMEQGVKNLTQEGRKLHE